MKKIPLLILLLFGAIGMNAQSIEGLWNTGKENTVVRIEKVSSEFEGKIHSSDYAKATKGKLIIKDVKYNNNTYKGKLYLIRRNRWIDAEFAPNKNSLIVTVSAGFQKKTMEWKSVI